MPLPLYCDPISFSRGSVSRETSIERSLNKRHNSVVTRIFAVVFIALHKDKAWFKLIISS
jgi:hypothetical protein